MNVRASHRGGAGWFGKIPALGDFVTRGLPLSFVQPWDEWLSAELSEARFLLAEDWAATYRQAPIWCFSLGVHAVDEHAWQGIIVPSFDRVGREFPLTIAQSRPRPAASIHERLWWDTLVAVGRRVARDPACGADGLDRTLAALLTVSIPPTPRTESGFSLDSARSPSVDGTSSWWAGSDEERHDALPEPTTFDGLPRGPDFRKLLEIR